MLYQLCVAAELTVFTARLVALIKVWNSHLRAFLAVLEQHRRFSHKIDFAFVDAPDVISELVLTYERFATPGHFTYIVAGLPVRSLVSTKVAHSFQHRLASITFRSILILETLSVWVCG